MIRYQVQIERRQTATVEIVLHDADHPINVTQGEWLAALGDGEWQTGEIYYKSYTESDETSN